MVDALRLHGHLRYVQRLRSVGMEVLRILSKKCPEYNSMLLKRAERFPDTRKAHLLQLPKY